jgi:hypothetical protein
MPMLTSQELYETMVANFYQNGYTGVNTNASLCGEALLRFTVLLLMLRFESKIDVLTYNLLFVALLAFTMYDGFCLVVIIAWPYLMGDSQVLDHATPYLWGICDDLLQINTDFHVAEAFIFALVAIMANATWKLYNQQLCDPY